MTIVLCENAYKAARKVYLPDAKRAKFPVLKCIHLYHHEGRLAMTTTDLQEEFTAYVPARWTEETWETCVPMKPFKNWLRVSVTKVDKHAVGRGVSDQIELTLDAPSQILKIQAGNTRAEFKCINAQEFPVCKESK